VTICPAERIAENNRPRREPRAALLRGPVEFVACCDAAVHHARKVFNAEQLQLYGGGGTDLRAGLRYFVERTEPIDLLIIVTDCQTSWPDHAPPFPVVIIRVGDGLPPPWSDRGSNKCITIEDPEALFQKAERQRKRRWRGDR